MFSIIKLKRLSLFLICLKLNLKNKKLFFLYRYSSKLVNFLKLLKLVGIVFHFFKFFLYKNNKEFKFFLIYLTFFHNILFFSIFSLLASAKNLLRISIRGLRLVSFRLVSSVLILSTSKGLLTHYDALHFGLGGIIILLIS